MAKSRDAKSSASQELLVIGLDADTGKPRAARFSQQNIAEVKQAALKMGMAVVRIDDGIAQAAQRIPAGKLSSDGTIRVGSISTRKFDALVRLIGLDLPGEEAGLVEETAKGTKLPSNWESISKGDLVLAPASPQVGGFWEAVVLGRTGDELTLLWTGRDWARCSKFKRAISLVGLLNPKLGQISAPNSESANEAESK